MLDHVGHAELSRVTCPAYAVRLVHHQSAQCQVGSLISPAAASVGRVLETLCSGELGIAALPGSICLTRTSSQSQSRFARKSWPLNRLLGTLLVVVKPTALGFTFLAASPPTAVLWLCRWAAGCGRACWAIHDQSSVPQPWDSPSLQLRRHPCAVAVQVGGRLRACLLGDNHVVNCLEQHPTLPLTLATSGAAWPSATQSRCGFRHARLQLDLLYSMAPLRARQLAAACRNCLCMVTMACSAERWCSWHASICGLSTAGIDNDVKIWAPTAVRAQEPAASPAVQRLLRDNSTGRGRSRAMQQVSVMMATWSTTLRFSKFYFCHGDVLMHTTGHSSTKGQPEQGHVQTVPRWQGRGCCCGSHPSCIMLSDHMLLGCGLCHYQYCSGPENVWCRLHGQVVITPRMLTQLLAAHGGALFGGIPRSLSDLPKPNDPAAALPSVRRSGKFGIAKWCSTRTWG
jgi:hypothetical protein